MKLVIDHVWLNGNKHITSPFFVMMSIGQFLMNTNRVRLQTNRNYKIRKKKQYPRFSPDEQDPSGFKNKVMLCRF